MGLGADARPVMLMMRSDGGVLLKAAGFECSWCSMLLLMRSDRGALLKAAGS